MRRLTIIILIFTSFVCLGQSGQYIRIRGTVHSFDSLAAENAYIINYRDLKVVISDENGRFNMWVQEGDSLMISYIGCVRSKIFADSFKPNAHIYLELDTINLGQIDVFTKPVDLWETVNNTVSEVKNQQFPKYTKISPNKNLMKDFVTEHNRLMRSEASSLSLIRISPSELISNIIRKSKVRKSIRLNRKKKK